MLRRLFPCSHVQEEPRSSQMWASETCTVWVGIDEAGSLYFAGLDRQGPNGGLYEYEVTVDRRAIPRVVAALGGQRGEDVVQLCVTHGEMIFKKGEMEWLKSLGLKPRLWLDQ